MRFQLLLVGIAAVVCFALGGARWRELWVSTRTYAEAEHSGRWLLVTGDYSGLHGLSRQQGAESIPGFSSVQVNQAWDVTRDLRRVALVDGYSYSGSPGLKVYAARRPDPIAETSPASGNSFYCPLFHDDGSLLFVDTTGLWGHVRRLEVPKVDSANATSRVTDVRTATAVKFDDCPELTEDGDHLAWIGTDSQIHIARETPSGYLGDHKTFTGSEFALTDDGSRMAIRDGSGIRLVDVALGTSRLLTSNSSYGTLVDFSPDGQWLAVMVSGSFSAKGIRALRATDAQEITLPSARNAYYYPQPGQSIARWITRP